MTEAVELTAEQKRIQDERISDELSASDFELQTLLDLMFGSEDEGVDASFGITLSLPSGIIGGTAITREAWTQRLNDLLRSAGANKLAEVREQIHSAVEPKRKEARAAQEAEGRPVPPRGFIHLKDAQLQSGGQTFKLKNTRVDLTHVSAWELGSWTTPVPED